MIGISWDENYETVGIPLHLAEVPVRQYWVPIKQYWNLLSVAKSQGVYITPSGLVFVSYYLRPKYICSYVD